MKKILLSLGVIVFVAVAAIGATGAFYGDTETSTGNTFTAGAIELKVDSQSHYNGMVCTDGGWQESDNPTAFGTPVGFPTNGSDCEGTWSETDLSNGIQKYFYFTDLKPGDHGEDTISLHVYDNDAWGRFEINGIVDKDSTCTDPEQEAENGQCGLDGTGEIDENLRFTAWLDQGSIPGFQNIDADGNVIPDEDGLVDLTEGDNIYQSYEGPKFWDNELISNIGPFDLKDVLSYAYGEDCLSYAANGHNNYGTCQGLASDGRMVGSTTYYFGLAWDLDLDTTGNDVQTDEYTADLTFRVEQYRNNPNPF